ncbi:hypothetical protein THASP1DRAFT_32786 [Thamnocephalis sphaerospora]|uniref:Aminotransferase n=1 Tax=Thamnocephalis sphaerospora TaxID=78915 RepID=A0A4P9XI69_9FUNG|nr:hypothetical protein THASP1DRAFT_32786 [Thamnocephalis sphaerospora]|eukprot:RKP05372.1 hypothetical protein THASP1DRAFT_32786 [Thamnocephalis sphaerospora]
MRPLCPQLQRLNLRLCLNFVASQRHLHRTRMQSLAELQRSETGQLSADQACTVLVRSAGPDWQALAEPSLNTRRFLLEAPRGAYTGMRTMNNAEGILDLRTHLQRLADSLKGMVFNGQSVASADSVQEPPAVTAALAAYRSAATLRPTVVSALRVGLERFHRLSQQHLGRITEAKIVVLVWYDEKAQRCQLWAHLSPLHVPTTRRCKVEVFGAPRHHPDVKDSQWVRDREYHETHKAKDTNEVLLCSQETHEIYEGTSSNFFAVMSAVDAGLAPSSAPEQQRQQTVLVTASPEFVLRGTVMRMVEDACRRLDLPLVHRFATTTDAKAGRWRGAFITSKYRPPIVLSECDTIDRIRALVEAEVHEKVEQIL